nr:2-phospho-L-lactate guanylyltransferase [Pseudomaricurvus alkylphenolicus]
MPRRHSCYRFARVNHGYGFGRAVQIIVPIKTLKLAKQRLRHVLQPADRMGLAKAMLRDVLNVVADHNTVNRVVLVSDDSFARQLATEFDTELLLESELQASGLNAVLQKATESLSPKAKEPLMVLHGDLPMLSAVDIEALSLAYHASRAPTWVIAPDRHGTGTNALLFPVTDIPRFDFGAMSFRSHVQQADQRSCSVQETQLEGLRCDIDIPEDLKILASASGNRVAPNSRAFLRQCGFEVAS